MSEVWEDEGKVQVVKDRRADPKDELRHMMSQFVRLAEDWDIAAALLQADADGPQEARLLANKWGQMLKLQIAAQNGSANFTPAMLGSLWRHSACPYSTPMYREAWLRGLYSFACWYLMSQRPETAQLLPGRLGGGRQP